jgi:nucleobase:cation symporter-1, NCS1 family
VVASPVREVRYPGTGPFPAGGLIPALKPLYDCNWVVGFATALILHYGLAMMGPRRPAAASASVPGPRAETADLPPG